jgi:hypothetical protein
MYKCSAATIGMSAMQFKKKTTYFAKPFSAALMHKKGHFIHRAKVISDVEHASQNARSNGTL